MSRSDGITCDELLQIAYDLFPGLRVRVRLEFGSAFAEIRYRNGDCIQYTTGNYSLAEEIQKESFKLDAEHKQKNSSTLFPSFTGEFKGPGYEHQLKFLRAQKDLKPEARWMIKGAL